MFRKILYIVFLPLTLLFFGNIRFVKPVDLSADENDKEGKNEFDKKDSAKFSLTEETKKYLQENKVNFNKDRLQLFFNKQIFTNSSYIKLQSNCSNLKLEDFILVRAEGNKVEILFKNKLKKNTTYIITFLRKSVISFDGNMLDDFNIVFSTGESVDSYVLKGSVVDLFKRKPMSNSYIFLYKLTEKEIKKGISDKNILNSNTPYYFTKCDMNGNYNFENISEGTYFICAGEIDTSNFISDSKLHYYGFLEDFISFSKDKCVFKDVNIYVLKNSISLFKITGKKFSKNKFIIETNGEIESFSIKVDDNFYNDYSEYGNLLKNASSLGPNKNEIIVDNDFIGLILNDVLPCFIEIKNNFGEKFESKINVEFKSDDINNDYNLKGTDSNEKELEIKAISDDSTIDSFANFKVKSKKEILTVDKDKIRIIIADKYLYSSNSIEDFNLVKNFDYFYLITDKKVSDIIEELKNGKNNRRDLLLKNDVKIIIKVEEGAILYSDFTKNKDFINSVLFLREYSSIPIDVDLKFKHFRVQLLDKNYSIIKDITDSNPNITNNSNIRSFVFEKVPYGEYTIRYFGWDGNRWDPGNIYRNVNYGFIGFYEDEININNRYKCEKILINLPKDDKISISD